MHYWKCVKNYGICNTVLNKIFIIFLVCWTTCKMNLWMSWFIVDFIYALTKYVKWKKNHMIMVGLQRREWNETKHKWWVELGDNIMDFVVYGFCVPRHNVRDSFCACGKIIAIIIYIRYLNYIRLAYIMHIALSHLNSA